LNRCNNYRKSNCTS